MDTARTSGKAIFRSLRSTAEERGVCGFRRRLVTGDDTEAANVTFLRIDNSRTHYHRQMTEYYYVLKGGGEVVLDGESTPVTEGDIVVIPPGIRHTSEGDMEVLIIGVPALETEDIAFD